MTPLEKAKELVGKFEKTLEYTDADTETVETDTYMAKQCAVIAVETHLDFSENDAPYGSMAAWIEGNKYWQQVKTEIQNL